MRARAIFFAMTRHFERQRFMLPGEHVGHARHASHALREKCCTMAPANTGSPPCRSFSRCRHEMGAGRRCKIRCHRMPAQVACTSRRQLHKRCAIGLNTRRIGDCPRLHADDEEPRRLSTILATSDAPDNGRARERAAPARRKCRRSRRARTGSQPIAIPPRASPMLLRARAGHDDAKTERRCFAHAPMHAHTRLFNRQCRQD